MNLLKKLKIELWLVILGFILIFIGMIFYGALVRHELMSISWKVDSKLPVLSRTALFLAEIPANLNQIIQGPKADLLAHEQRFKFSGFQGQPLEEEVYLLLTKYDGSRKESIVELIDLRTFEVKKTWNPDITQINSLVDISYPEFKSTRRDSSSERYSITHPFLTEDGGLIFQNNSPLVKINKDSQLVWQNQEDAFHHSIEQDYEGNFWVPTGLFPYRVSKNISPEFGSFQDDAITKVSPDGKILFQKSVSNIFIENNMGHYIFPIVTFFSADPIHLNDIQPVMNDGPYWKRGDIFMSLRHLSMILLYRPSTNEIIWYGAGETVAQHDINILDDHRISIFNNNLQSLSGIAGKGKVDKQNEILIYDFKTNSYSKYLNESLKKYDVRTVSQGRSRILDNNDLYVAESNSARLLYFNADGSLRWQFVNRAEDDGKAFLMKWPRIFYSPEDLNKIHKVLESDK